MTSREQFEKWFKSDYHPDKSGPYLKDALFLAWQASRAAVDIEILSDPFIAIKKDATNYDFYNAGIESAKRAITNAGIKVKDC